MVGSVLAAGELTGGDAMLFTGVDTLHIRRWAHYCQLARTDPDGAARGFIAETDDAAAEKLIDCLTLTDEHVEDFEARGLAVRISGPFGTYRLAAASRGALLPPLPRISPRDLKALALAVAKRLEN